MFLLLTNEHNNKFLFPFSSIVFITDQNSNKLKKINSIVTIKFNNSDFEFNAQEKIDDIFNKINSGLNNEKSNKRKTCN